MPKYLSLGKYTESGIKGLMHEGGTARRNAIKTAVEAAGGKLEAYYFAFGDYDVVAIVDAPDNVTAAAMSLAVAAGGAATSTTVVLLTPEEVDRATKMSMKYTPPRQ